MVPLSNHGLKSPITKIIRALCKLLKMLENSNDQMKKERKMIVGNNLIIWSQKCFLEATGKEMGWTSSGQIIKKADPKPLKMIKAYLREPTRKIGIK